MASSLALSKCSASLLPGRGGRPGAPLTTILTSRNVKQHSGGKETAQGGETRATHRKLVDPDRGHTRVAVCPSCSGTGMKPCGQCAGTGVQREDKFGSKAGDPCWLCEGVAQTMCGICVDLTDAF